MEEDTFYSAMYFFQLVDFLIRQLIFFNLQICFYLCVSALIFSLQLMVRYSQLVLTISFDKRS